MLKLDRFNTLCLKHLKRIAIDEIYLGKKTKYLTLVMDLATGAVVYIGDGKGSGALKPFWKKLRTSKANIEAVAMDMGKPILRLSKKIYLEFLLYLITFMLLNCITRN